MKRIITAVILIGVIGFFGLVSIVNAQDTTPETPEPGYGYGRGRGMMGGYAAMGPMHEYMEQALADQLDMSVEELEERHANGETFWQIAEEKGYTVEEATELKLEARSIALDQMVEDGLMTEEQAEWMKNRGAGMMQGQGRGRGGCMGGNSDGTFAPRGRWSRDG